MRIPPEYGVRVRCLDPFDYEWGWYWTLTYNGEHVNGGIAKHLSDGQHRAESAAFAHEQRTWFETHYWDVETGRWYKKGEYPP